MWRHYRFIPQRQYLPWDYFYLYLTLFCEALRLTGCEQVHSRGILTIDGLAAGRFVCTLTLKHFNSVVNAVPFRKQCQTTEPIIAIENHKAPTKSRVDYAVLSVICSQLFKTRICHILCGKMWSSSKMFFSEMLVITCMYACVGIDWLINSLNDRSPN